MPELLTALPPIAPPATASPPAPATHGTESLRRRTIHGGLWTLGGYVASQVLRLAGNVIVARFLFPSAFGLIAIVSAVLQGLQMMSDLGVRGTMIASGDGDRSSFLNTAWTVQLCRALFVFVFGAAIAWPLAEWYQQPQLLLLLPISTLSVVFTALGSPERLKMLRQLHVRAVVLVDLLGQAIGVGVTLCWLAFDGSVWCMVAGGLTTSAVSSALSYVLMPHRRPRLAWDREAVRQMVSYGRWVFISTGTAFVAAQFDRLLLGRMLSMHALGIYSIAVVFAAMPKQLVNQLTSAVLQPALAAVKRRDEDAVRRQFVGMRRVVLWGGLGLCLSMVFLSPGFFELLYDLRYRDAGTYSQLLSLAIWFSVLQCSADRILLAEGDARSVAISNVVNAVATVAACVGGYYVAGLPGLIAGTSLGNLAGHVVIQHTLAGRGMSIVRDDVVYTGLFLAMSVGGTMLASFLSHLLGLRPSVVTVAVGLPLLAACGYVLLRLLSIDLRSLLRKLGVAR